MPIHNVFFYLQNSASGTAQINQGPFHPGTVNRLLKVENHGQMNFVGVTQLNTGSYVNATLWGIQWVAHGASPLDILLSTDSDQWLVRQQVSGEEYQTVWTPQTDDPGLIGGYGNNVSWRGQYPIGADTDFYLSWALPFGGSWVSFNSFGCMRIWWT